MGSKLELGGCLRREHGGGITRPDFGDALVLLNVPHAGYSFIALDSIDFISSLFWKITEIFMLFLLNNRIQLGYEQQKQCTRINKPHYIV